MIKRAIISGLHSTGVQVADLRTLPAPVGKHLLKTQGYDAAFHVGAVVARSGGGADPALRAPGHRALGGDAEGGREALHAPGAAPRPVRRRRRRSRTRRGRARATRATCSPISTSEAIRARGFRIVVDYGYSAGELRAAARARAARRRGGHGARVRVRLRRRPPARLRETIDQAQRLVRRGQRRLRRGLRPLGRADLPDRRDAGGRCGPTRRCCSTCSLIGRERPPRARRRPDHRDEPGRGRRRRPASRSCARPASLPELTRAAAEEGVVFAGAAGGGYVFPELPAGLRRDGVALQAARAARAGRAAPLSELVARAAAADARSTAQVQCPWALKGTVMRVLNERFADAQRRPARRDQGLRRARLGAGAAGPRRAARSTSTPRASSDELSEELETRAPRARHRLIEREEIGAAAGELTLQNP